MKLSSIFALLILIVVVKGNWWAAAAQPAILGFSAIMAALNSEEIPDIDVYTFEWGKLVPPFLKKDKKTKKAEKAPIIKKVPETEVEVPLNLEGEAITDYKAKEEEIKMKEEKVVTKTDAGDYLDRTYE